MIPEFYGVEFPYSFNLNMEFASYHPPIRFHDLISITDLMLVYYVTLSPSFSLSTMRRPVLRYHIVTIAEFSLIDI